MRTIFKAFTLLLDRVFEAVLIVVAAPIFLYLMVQAVIIPATLLFGTEKPSPLCESVKNGRTRFEILMFPIAEYGCKKDAGLLQPYAKNFFKWLGEVPK